MKGDFSRFALWIIAVALTVIAGTSVINVIDDDGDRIAEAVRDVGIEASNAQAEAIDRQTEIITNFCLAFTGVGLELIAVQVAGVDITSEFAEILLSATASMAAFCADDS